MDRRKFIQRSGAAAAGLWLAGSTRGKGQMANDEIVMAVVGINGQGKVHFQNFSSINGVRVKTICDVDERLFPQAQSLALNVTGNAVNLETDFRRVLEDPEIDAVSIATPNHWHTLMTIWACQAGKHVYVEKPASHNIWEGRQAVQAVRDSGCIVAHGTQARSDTHFREAIRLLHEGVIGDVYLARGLVFRVRDSIGHKPDMPVPAGLHFDLWLGPAPQRPFNENLVHYNWHWFWDFGNGDLGNQGVHEVDIALWGLNKTELPRYIQSMGGYFVFDSDQETPNTQLITYRWDDGVLMHFEVRGLHTNSESGVVVGNFFYGSEGWMHVDRSGFRTFLGRSNEPGPKMDFVPGKSAGLRHGENFIEAIRNGDSEALTAGILKGHLSSAACHLGNIAYRLDRRLEFDSASEQFVGDQEANAYLSRNYREPFVVPALASTPGFGQALRFAHLGDGPGITSTLVLVNPWREPVGGEVSLLGNDGNPLPVALQGPEIEGQTPEGSFSFLLPAQGIAYFRTPGQGTVRTGWAEVRSSLALGGTILFTGDFGSAGVGSAWPGGRFMVPVEARQASGVHTGVALANPADQPVSVDLILRNRSGEEVPDGFATVVLAARGQLARFVEELYQGQGIDFSDFDGTLEAISTTPVVAMAILQTPGEFATLPVTPA